MASSCADGGGATVAPEPSSKSLLRSLLPKRRNGNTSNAPAPKNMTSRREETVCEGIENRGAWSFLPVDVQNIILAKLPCKDLFRAKTISKWFNDHINSDEFHDWRAGMHLWEVGELTALHFGVEKHGLLQCSGYDLIDQTWKSLPPFHMLPLVDPKLFKDHSMCAAGGLMCANVITSSQDEKIIVFNPLTGRWRELPQLNRPRSPVLLQLVHADSTHAFYKVVAAGSAKGAHDENLSKTTEVFDSRTGVWTVAQDMPGPLFALNEHQTGVVRNGILYCVAFLEGEGSGRGVVAFGVDEGRWLPHLSCPLPSPGNVNIVQLVDSTTEPGIVVFSEIDHNFHVRSVEQRIDVLEDVVVTQSGQGRGKWRNVMSETKAGSQAGLLVYPEFAGVPFGERKVCVFNTIARKGIVYDMLSGKRIDLVSPWPSSMTGSGEIQRFYSMNPLTFCFQPNFKAKPS